MSSNVTKRTTSPLKWRGYGHVTWLF